MEIRILITKTPIVVFNFITQTVGKDIQSYAVNYFSAFNIKQGINDAKNISFFSFIDEAKKGFSNVAIGGMQFAGTVVKKAFVSIPKPNKNINCTTRYKF
jgi:hypothetical protein